MDPELKALIGKAEDGHADAQNIVGWMHSNGKGVPRNFEVAVEWYIRAAEQGLAKAQFNLGVMYANGNGVPQDYVRAYMWFCIAASSGQKTALDHRDIIEASLMGYQIEGAEDTAADWIATHEHKWTAI